MEATTLQLVYLGGPHQFLSDLCHQGDQDTAKAIRSRLKEVCRQKKEHPDLVPHGTTKNMYRLIGPAAPADGPTHPGFEFVIIVAPERVIVVEIRMLAS